MTIWKDPTSNPTTVSANVKYNSNGNIIDVGNNTYNGIGIVYSTDPPKSTTIALTALAASKDVSNIQTTKVGGHPTSQPWTNNNGVWTYSIPTDFIGTAKHTIHFKVTWSDGTTHDPQIVINPTN
jgi:hypothetical protein